MGGDGNPAEREDSTMDTTSTERDQALAVTYRDLIAADLALGSAQRALFELGWKTAGNDMSTALAVVRDLLHDLQVYGSGDGTSAQPAQPAQPARTFRYAGLPASSRRSAARLVRRRLTTGTDVDKAARTYADLYATSATQDGEPDLHWLYCYELADRLATVRYHEKRRAVGR